MLDLRIGLVHLVTGRELDGVGIVAGEVGVRGVGNLMDGGDGVVDVDIVVSVVVVVGIVVDVGIVVVVSIVVDVSIVVVVGIEILCVDARGWCDARCIGKERTEVAGARSVSGNEVFRAVSCREAAIAAGTGELHRVIISFEG